MFHQLVGERTLILHHPHVLAVLRQRHCLRRHPFAPAVDDLVDRCVIERDIGAHSIGHARTDLADEPLELNLISRRISDDGSLAPIVAWLRFSAVSDERQHRLHHHALSGHDAQLS